MTLGSDPLFVTAEVAYRREKLATGFHTDRTPRRHHGAVLALLTRTPRLHHRHGIARTA